MATSGQEVELLDKGTIAVTPTRGPFALNMLYRHEAWEVRRGFGQVAQYDTTMSLNPPVHGGVATDWGYRKHLGSKLIHTSFGHDQILSVFHAFNMTTNNLDAARQLDLYMVSIYDLTNDTRWEEPLYRHTSELDAGNEDADSWHGHYETDLDTDNQKWVAGRDDEYFYFVDSAINADTDVLFFGSSHTGVWVYIPAIFRHANRKFLDSTNQHEWTRPYGESSMVRPLGTVVPTTLSGESFQYFRPDEVDRVNVVGKLGKRLVYGLDHILLFSDDDAPAQIVTDNFLTIPSDYPITAMADYNGQLLIWTTNETFIYSPSSGDLVVGGRLMKISDTVGCLGPNAWSRVDDLLFFIDSQGVYLYDGRLGVKLASGDIDKFFTDFITNPLTSYFTYSGYTQMGTEQPHTTMSFHPSGVNVSYSAHLRALLITVPEQNLTLCLSGSRWSVWSYTSSVYVATVSDTESSYPGIVQDTDNPAGFVTAPWLLAGQDDLFMIGSVDTQEFTDTSQITTNGVPASVSDNVKAASHYILRYGRGGAIDRSVREEDDRRIAGKYITQQYSPMGVNTARFYVDPWLPVPKAFVFPNGYVVTDYEEVWLCPLVVVAPVNLVAANEIHAYKIHVRFDNSEWKPIVAAVSQSSETKVDFLLPSERIASAFGYFDPASTPGGTMDTDHEFRVYNSVTGLLQNSGNELRLAWSGVGQTPASTYGWYHAPSMSLNADRRNTVVYVPMRRTGATTEVSGMALFAPNTTVDGHGLPWMKGTGSPPDDYADDAGFIPWEQWTTTSPRKEDSVAQPVDWAYKSDRIGDGAQGLKARGTWTRMLSHGKGIADDYIAQGPSVDWLYGMYNIAVASEGKGWVMQVVDATAATPGYEESIGDFTLEPTIRTRVLDSSVLSDNVFGDTRSKWGTTIFGSGTQGTTLVVDEEVSEMATSLSVKGRHFTYMFFGFMQNRAQRLILESSKAVIRALGGRRRRGR